MIEPRLIVPAIGRARMPSALASRIRDQIMLTLLVAQPNSVSARMTTDRRAVGRAAIGDAVDFIEAHPATATPHDAAAEAGVSLRALQDNFKDALGTTPHAYILQTRLRRASNDLLAARGGFLVTVTDVARRSGFTNVGRFDEEHWGAYQEKPSDTLRAARGEAS
ncbi:helix-turn-helix domain-containing protein [Mycobacterium sp. BMJ-28]